MAEKNPVSRLGNKAPWNMAFRPETKRNKVIKDNIAQKNF